MDSQTERGKRAKRRDEVRAQQEMQNDIEVLFRQADEIIRSVRESSDERQKLSYAGIPTPELLSEDDISEISRHGPFQPLYPSSAESFKRHIDRDAEQVQHRTSTPKKTPIVADREDLDRQKYSLRDNLWHEQNAVALRRMNISKGLVISKKEIEKGASKQQEEIFLSCQNRLT